MGMESTEVIKAESTVVSEKPETVETESPEVVKVEGVVMSEDPKTAGNERKAWIEAFQQAWPIYLSTHLAFAALTYLGVLFRLNSYADIHFRLKTLLDSWDNWDSNWYSNIALHGYPTPKPMAFFPLYPLLERVLTPLMRDPFYAGLLISNLAGLGMFMVLYRLVAADFGRERAWRTVLYLAVFPTAFFFAAAYTESLFMFLSLLTIFLWRRGHWWWAGLVAVFSGLTRSTSVCLLVLFAYEYLRQHDFQWRKFRFDVLSGTGIAGGVILFGIYGYVKFHDALAFSHAEKSSDWQRAFNFPWVGFQGAINIITHSPLLSFVSLHNMIDLGAGLFTLGIIILAFVGPARFRKEHLGYALYAVALYLLITLVPSPNPYPNTSMSRYVLEIFPAFIVLGAFGQRRNFNLYYLTVSVSLLAFIVLQWVTGGMIV